LPNNVFVLGGGRTGLVAVRDLIRSKRVDHITIGDRDISRAQQLVSELQSDKLTITEVDLADRESLLKAIRNSKVLMNATWYEYNVEVMKAAIEARVHYTDLGGLFHVTRKQMELDGVAKAAGVTAVLGSGESPGITNVMCASSAEGLDTLEEIHIRVGGREILQKSRKTFFPFAISTIFDEYSKPPIVYLNGQFQQVEPLSGEETVDFPDPVGANLCHYCIHSEIATLPINLEGVKTVDFKLGISEQIYKLVKPLIDAGMADTTPIEVKGHKISPRDFAISLLSTHASDEDPPRYVAIKTEVTGSRKGRKIKKTHELTTGPSEEMGVRNATALLTGVGASIVVQLILSGQITKTGVLAPETCVPAPTFMAELEKRTIESRQYVKEI
jgi:saccharopine dehydrogenase-like NADP-dependent oxidoreductase